MRRTTPKLIIGAIATAALLVGCSATQESPELVSPPSTAAAPAETAIAPAETGYDIPEDAPPAETPTEAEPTADPTTEDVNPLVNEPFLTTVRVERVLSGDSIEATVLDANGFANTPLPELVGQRITVKFAGFDAPKADECGFEESKAFMASRLSAEPRGNSISDELEVTPPPFVEGDDRQIMLMRLVDLYAEQPVGLTPAQDTEGRYLLALVEEGRWLGNYHFVKRGHARLSDDFRAIASRPAAAQDVKVEEFIGYEEQAKAEGQGLWASCWQNEA